MPEPIKIVINNAPQPIRTIVVSERVTVTGSGGDVDGPASSTDDNLASFDGTTGKVIQDSGISKASVQAAITQAGTAIQGSTGANDNRLIRADGTGGKTVQASTIILNDTGDLSAISSAAFTPIAAPSHVEGKVFYDSTDKSLTYYNDEAEISMNIGREMWARVRNSTGSTILDGTCVYIMGATGQLPNIVLGQANAEVSSRLIGVTTHDIENNSNGYVTIFGEVKGLNTSAYSDGDILYLSPSVAGAFTATKPSSPNFVVQVGVVEHAHVTQGKILVHPELDSVTSALIQDSTSAGRAMLTAADAAAQTALLNVFTSLLKGLVPASGGGTTNFLRADGTFAAPPAGDVVGPASATDNALARFDNTTGKLIQSSTATLDDAGALTLFGPVNITGGGNDLIVAGNTASDIFSTFPYFAFGTPKVGVLTGNNAFAIEWTPSGSFIDTSDVGIVRGAIGVAKITDGSTGDGSLETLSVIFAGGPTDTTGAGSPESVVTAVVGSTYRRTDGGTNTTLYRKESGTGNTGWVAVTNAGGGGGDVVGPASSVDGEIALFDSTTGKLIKRATGTGPVKVTSGVFNTGSINLASEVTGTLPVANGGTGITSLGTGVATFLGTPSSANLAAALTDETGSGAAVFGTSPTLTTPTISGAITFPDDVRQTFNPGTTNAGLNVGALAGDPSTPSNGDLWYDSTANELTARINGSNVALGSGGSGVLVDYSVIQDFSVSSTTNTMPVDDTKPQSSEGDQYNTQSYSATSGNILIAKVSGYCSRSNAGIVGIALFKDSDTDALVAYPASVSGTNLLTYFQVTAKLTVASTGSITFKLRYGAASAATSRINQQTTEFFDNIGFVNWEFYEYAP